jgi:hypothetical protein
MSDNPDNLKNDYEYSRQTYYELVEKGKDALESMIEVARESEHPRAYEVLAGLIKNTSDVNDKLMDLNKKQKDLLQKAEEESKQPQIGQQTNNVFLGSTADIQRLLQNGDDIVDVTPERNVSRKS